MWVDVANYKILLNSNSLIFLDNKVMHNSNNLIFLVSKLNKTKHWGNKIYNKIFKIKINLIFKMSSKNKITIILFKHYVIYWNRIRNYF